MTVEPVAAPRTAPVTGPAAGGAARADLRAAAVLVAALAVLGAALGVLWALWSPPGPAAEVLGGGLFVPDETESFVAGDGRYFVLVAVVGIAAAVLTWLLLPRHRGPLMIAGLAVGSGVGALLTELVGHLTGGGSFTGKVYDYSDGSRHRVSLHLPLSLHAQGLLFVGPVLAVLVYGLFVAFAVRDDLGRPDETRERLRAERSRATGSVGAGSVGAGSVEAGGHPQDGGGDGDAPRALQQGDLTP